MSYIYSTLYILFTLGITYRWVVIQENLNKDPYGINGMIFRGSRTCKWTDLIPPPPQNHLGSISCSVSNETSTSVVKPKRGSTARKDLEPLSHTKNDDYFCSPFKTELTRQEWEGDSMKQPCFCYQTNGICLRMINNSLGSRHVCETKVKSTGSFLQNLGFHGCK